MVNLLANPPLNTLCMYLSLKERVRLPRLICQALLRFWGKKIIPYKSIGICLAVRLSISHHSHANKNHHSLIYHLIMKYLAKKTANSSWRFWFHVKHKHIMCNALGELVCVHFEHRQFHRQWSSPENCSDRQVSTYHQAHGDHNHPSAANLNR